MHVIAVGTRFFPKSHAGDKTFWLQLCRRIADQGDRITVLNLDARSKPVEHLGPRMRIETLPAIPVRLRAGPQAERYNLESREIGAITNYGSKTVTLPRLLRRLQALVREDPADAVHLIDNMGPAARILAMGLREPPVYASAITYDPRFALYDQFLKASLAPFRSVAVTTDTFRARLEEVGLDPSRLRTVRWGSDPQEHRPSADPSAAKRALGIDPTAPVAFWSGYIQQVTEPDFFLAYRVATEARRLLPELHVWFCFKPWHFRPSYAAMEQPGIHLRGDEQSFRLAREAADLFLSPVSRTRSILAPPLTWVETMMRGIPILSTPNAGLAEVLGPAQAGVGVAVNRLVPTLVDLVRDRARLAGFRETARAWAVSQFSLDGAVRGYLDLWSGAAGSPGDIRGRVVTHASAHAADTEPVSTG